MNCSLRKFFRKNNRIIYEYHIIPLPPPPPPPTPQQRKKNLPGRLPYSEFFRTVLYCKVKCSLIATRCHITVFSVLEINRSRKTPVVCYTPFLQMWTSVNICHHFAKMENVSIMTGAIVVNVRWDSSWMRVEKSVLVSSKSSALVK